MSCAVKYGTFSGVYLTWLMRCSSFHPGPEIATFSLWIRRHLYLIRDLSQPLGVTSQWLYLLLGVLTNKKCRCVQTPTCSCFNSQLVRLSEKWPANARSEKMCDFITLSITEISPWDAGDYECQVSFTPKISRIIETLQSNLLSLAMSQQPP